MSHDRKIRVYVSSTYTDLKDHRAAVNQSLLTAGYELVAMENYPAFDERPLDKCLNDVASSDVYVGIVAWRYGFIPAEGNAEGLSITEREYRHAEENCKRLIFLVDPDTPWPPKWIDQGADAEKLTRFRADLENGHGRQLFSDPDELAKHVLESLTTLEGPGGALSVEETLALPLNNLPPATAHFEGRGEEEEQLITALTEGQGSQAISALRGLGGIGKTELAVRVAHRLTPHYRAAQVLIDLKGTEDQETSVRDAMEGLIRRFEPEASLPDDDQAVAEIYRDMLRHRKALLILDNAKDASQVLPLLPPAPSAGLVTSRPLLDLPGVRTYRIDSLARPQSRALLTALLGSPAVADGELDGLAGACADHPLSLQVAGNFLAKRRNRLALDNYATRITENRDRLRLEGVVGYDVMAALEASLKLLLQEDPELAERWRDLAVFPADFDSAAAAAVWDLQEDQQPADTARALLHRLEDMAFAEAGSSPERFRLHDLMHDLARRGQPVQRFAAPAIRHAEYYSTVLAKADELYLQGGAQAALEGLQLYDLERDNLEAGQALAAGGLTSNPTLAKLAVQYANDGVYVPNLRQHSHERISWGESGLAGAREIADPLGEVVALGNLGVAHRQIGEIAKAIDLFKRQLVLTREIGNRRGENGALGNLGLAYADLGEIGLANSQYEQALAIARETGDQRSVGNSLGNLGVAYRHLHETQKAIELYKQQLAVVRQIGDRRGEGIVLGNLGVAYFDLHQTEEAIKHYEQQLKIVREIGDRRGEASALGNLGLAYDGLGEVHKAIVLYKQVLTITRKIDDRRSEGNVLFNLGVAHYHLGETSEAVKFYEQALVIYSNIEDRRGEGRALANLGSAFVALSETKKGIEHLEHALSIFTELKDPYAENVRNWLAKARTALDSE